MTNQLLLRKKTHIKNMKKVTVIAIINQRTLSFFFSRMKGRHIKPVKFNQVNYFHQFFPFLIIKNSLSQQLLSTSTHLTLNWFLYKMFISYLTNKFNQLFCLFFMKVLFHFYAKTHRSFAKSLLQLESSNFSSTFCSRLYKK